MEHVNVGVGQLNQEEKKQIIDATEGLTMNARNNNPDQIVPATEGSINQTYTPYSTKSEPVKQESINWTYLRGKIWGN